MEETRDEEVEMQHISEEGDENAEEEAKVVTDETPAVNTKLHSKWTERHCKKTSLVKNTLKRVKYINYCLV